MSRTFGADLHNFIHLTMEAIEEHIRHQHELIHQLCGLASLPPAFFITNVKQMKHMEARHPNTKDKPFLLPTCHHLFGRNALHMERRP